MTIQSRERYFTIADNPIAAIYLTPSVAQEDRIAELGAAIGEVPIIGIVIEGVSVHKRAPTSSAFENFEDGKEYTRRTCSTFIIMKMVLSAQRDGFYTATILFRVTFDGNEIP